LCKSKLLSESKYLLHSFLQFSFYINALELKVYEIFKSKFSEQEAATVIEYFEAKAEAKYQEKKDYLATKDDVGVLRKEIAEAKADVIKWMFLFWIGQVAATFGLVLLFLKK